METSEEVKRELAKSPNDPLFQGFHGCNAEDDIEETRPQAEHHLQSFFEMELAYWKAMEEERYADAKTILQAMTVMRKSKELIYQIECINWKLDLAGRTGDVELFLDAIASMPDDPESALNEDSVKANLKQVLFNSGMCEIKVAVSLEGQRRVAREASPVEFLRGQTDVFTASLITQVINAILLNKHMAVHEFTKLVLTATEDSKRAFLSVHPFITDLVVVWKKKNNSYAKQTLTPQSMETTADFFICENTPSSLPPSSQVAPIGSTYEDRVPHNCDCFYGVPYLSGNKKGRR